MIYVQILPNPIFFDNMQVITFKSYLTLMELFYLKKKKTPNFLVYNSNKNNFHEIEINKFHATVYTGFSRSLQF